MARRANTTSLVLLAMTLAGGAIHATPASAQDTTSTEQVTVDREMMMRFARAHLAINDARDEFHGKVARVHDAEGRARAREEVEVRIKAILEEQEMTRATYDEIILRISLDGVMRTMFEETVAQLEQERNGVD